jgi:hypothetical protein
MKTYQVAIVLAVWAAFLCGFQSSKTVTTTTVTTTSSAQTLVDIVGTGVSQSAAGPNTDARLSSLDKTTGGTGPLTWPEDRLIKGWSIWYGFGWNTSMEGEVNVKVENRYIGRRGPHKEAGIVMYDTGEIDTIPGPGVFVKAGERVYITTLLRNTSSARVESPPSVATMQANCIFYSTVQ